MRPRFWLTLVGALALSGVTHGAGKEVVWLHGSDGRGRPFEIEQLRGQVVALTFISRYTRDEGAKVNDALASKASPGDVGVVSVIDFAGVPSLFHGYARRKVAEADDGRVRHLVDEQGNLRSAFHVEPDRRVDILVIDRDGTLRGRYVGARQLEAALRMVEELRSTTRAER